MWTPSMSSMRSHCWLGDRKSVPPVTNWVIRRWSGYLSGARKRGLVSVTPESSLSGAKRCRCRRWPGLWGRWSASRATSSLVQVRRTCTVLQAPTGGYLRASPERTTKVLAFVRRSDRRGAGAHLADLAREMLRQVVFGNRKSTVAWWLWSLWWCQSTAFWHHQRSLRATSPRRHRNGRDWTPYPTQAAIQPACVINVEREPVSYMKGLKLARPPTTLVNITPTYHHSIYKYMSVYAGRVACCPGD